MHELGLGTSLCSHETNPFVVQPYKPILLIVLPYRLLVCSKTSKPPSLGPWHTHNHHTMDSSPNSSRREDNSSLPIVRPTHVITILRTPRHLAADRNYTVSCPSCVPPSSTSQTPTRLNPSSPNTANTSIYSLHFKKYQANNPNSLYKLGF